jgi:formylglycine-generating enzyme required for sulfatase activity
LHLPAFYLSRYPITNAQYRPFVESGCYERPDYWTAEGWAWRRGEREPDLSPIQDESLRENYAAWLERRPAERRDRPFWWDDPSWGLPNRPAVGVTWYEALAYCRWLEEQLQVSGCRLKVWQEGQTTTCHLQRAALNVRLPSEAEWEKAARGAHGFTWPWGDEWVDGRANTEEAGIGETSAVGCFPSGASSCGGLDMAGNVWEWTHSKWGRTSTYRPDYAYPYDAEDGRESLDGPDFRVVRGGSWGNSSWFARCAVRHWGIPGDWSNYIGFRVVVSPRSAPGA